MSFDLKKQFAKATGISSSVSSVTNALNQTSRAISGAQRNVNSAINQVQGIADSVNRKNFVDGLIASQGVDTIAAPVREGMAALSRVSEIIRTGGSGSNESPLARTALSRIVNISENAIETGANAIMDIVGLGNVEQVLSNINLQAVDNAFQSASDTFAKVRAGRLAVSELTEASGVFSNTYDLVQGASMGSKGRAIPIKREMQKHGASAYAQALVDSAPKHKFLYIIDIDFNPPYTDWNDIGKSMAFSTKRCGRPQVDFEYEEVNMYNFRTRVAKRTTYQPMTMVFHDDQTNNSHLFYTAYMRAMSPLANVSSSTNFKMAEENGMDFNSSAHYNTFSPSDKIPTRGYTGSIGSLNGNNISLIKEIRLYHVFNYGKLMNVYHFHHPRITSLTPSELSMAETGEGSEFEFQFVYDGLWVAPAVDVHKEMNASSMEGGNYNITNLAGNNGNSDKNQGINPLFSADYDVTKEKMMSNAPTFQNNSGESRGSVSGWDRASGTDLTPINTGKSQTAYDGSSQPTEIDWTASLPPSQDYFDVPLPNMASIGLLAPDDIPPVPSDFQKNTGQSSPAVDPNVATPLTPEQTSAAITRHEENIAREEAREKPSKYAIRASNRAIASLKRYESSLQ